jgi:hypothetical protein
MASATTTSSIRPPVETSNVRPRLSLGNQDVNLGASFQSLGPLVPPGNPTNKIHTFFIWSIFNLLLLPFGILCCYFSRKVYQFKKQNRYELAKRWSKRTFVLNIMSTLIMFGFIITVAMLNYAVQQENLDTQGNQTRTTGAYIPWQPGR